MPQRSRKQHSTGRSSLARMIYDRGRHYHGSEGGERTISLSHPGDFYPFLTKPRLVLQNQWLLNVKQKPNHGFNKITSLTKQPKQDNCLGQALH